MVGDISNCGFVDTILPRVQDVYKRGGATSIKPKRSFTLHVLLVDIFSFLKPSCFQPFCLSFHFSKSLLRLA
ncbi:hypothetical protein KIN20_022954 [Parelaphostrongylus tenuis]|uniref:Uncharacterized protein n=1 Tax=Parelaphostrongylus tenuis TaxID=148309 RepID=A0AAD5QVL3_PARTN|nr:hypothetical protein KIN20_022954 [Parelaphostrongylus tenuis]